MKTKTVLASLFLAFPLLLAACSGRPEAQNRTIPVANYGVKLGTPAVVSFSALWCHPCREEIETLNQANTEFAGQLQFTGFLVEGEQKGGTVQASDLDLFTSFNGVKPTYPLATDEGWRRFDAFSAPQGRALPTLLLINRSGQIQQIVQQSLDYKAQLRPLLVALLAGEAPPADSEPKPAPAPPGQQQLTETIPTWTTRAEVTSRPELLQNLTSAWEAGLTKNNFKKTEMPLDSGKMTFAWDGKESNTPQLAKWNAITDTSICQLTITLDANANATNINGSCRPK